MSFCKQWVPFALCCLFVTWVFLPSSQAVLETNSAKVLDETDLREMFNVQYDFSESEINTLVGILKQKPEFLSKEGSGQLKIGSVLSTQGFNFALIEDYDTLVMDAVFFSPETHERVRLEESVYMAYQNQGAKSEATYRKLMVFLPPDIHLEDLSLESFGPGIGASFECLSKKPTKIWLNKLKCL